jgi:uncharacterized protein YdeI (BOF family)
MVRLRMAALFLIVLLVTASIQAQTTPEPGGSLLVAPRSGAPGTLHLIFAEDLPANTAYELQIAHVDTGEALVTTSLTSANNGTISYNFTSEADAVPGAYQVTLSQDGQVVRSSTLTIEGVVEAQTGNLLVAPASGLPGTLHLIFAEDLTPNTRYQLVINSTELGAALLSKSVTSDSNGSISYNFTTPAAAAPGTYDVSLLTTTEVVRTGTLTVEGETATEEPTVAQPTVTPTPSPTVPATSTPAVDASGDAILRGTPLSGELTNDTEQNEYSFTGQAGEVVVIRMESADFDSYLLLLDEAGNVVMRNDNGAGNFNAEISGFTLPADGVYTIVATSRPNIENRSAESIGAYTLLLNSAREANSGEIASGETIIGTIGADSEAPQYTFTAQEGDTITVDLASDDFDPFVVLVSPEGNQVASDDDTGPGLYARLERLVVTEAGEYTIIVDGFRGPTGERSIEGDYRLTLRIEGEDAVVFQPTAVPTEESQPTEAPTTEATPEDETDVLPIAYGETVEGELTEELQTGLYSFEGSAGDVVSIALNSDDFDPLVILLDSEGNEIASDDDAGPGVYSLIEDFTLPADDTYTIMVDGYRGVNGDRSLSGAYTLSLSSDDAAVVQPTEEVPAPTPLPTLEGASGVIISGETITGVLDNSVQTARYTFNASAGDVVTIDLLSQDFDPFVVLLDEAGNVISEDDDSGGNSQARIEAFELPVDGEYTIVVDAFRGFSGNQTVSGEYSLSLMIVEGAARPTVPPTDDSATPLATLGAPEMTPTPTMPQPQTPFPTPTPFAVLPELNINVMEAEAESIELGEQFEVEFTGELNEAYVFTFEAAAGQALSVYSFSDGEIDTILRLFAPDGSQIAVDDDSGSTNDPEIQQVITPQDGEYRLVVQPYVNGANGTLTLFALDLQPFEWEGDTITYGVAAKIAAYSPLLYEAEAGDTLRLYVRRRDAGQSGGTARVTITQNDTVLVSNEVGIGAGVALDFIVPNDGDLTITFTYQGAGGTILEVTMLEAE